MSSYVLRQNPHLTGLVAEFGGPAVESASLAANGFPALMVATTNEATAILNELEKRKALNHGV